MNDPNEKPDVYEVTPGGPYARQVKQQVIGDDLPDDDDNGYWRAFY